jgi:hypothetical protein
MNSGLVLSASLLEACQTTTPSGLTVSKTGMIVTIYAPGTGNVLATAELKETYNSLGQKVWRYVILSGPKKGNHYEFRTLQDAVQRIDDILRHDVVYWDTEDPITDDQISELTEVLSTIWVDPDPPANP